MQANNGHGPRRYRIVVRGRLSECDGDAFEDMTLEPGVGETILEGELVDQAQVYGVLDRLRGLGLELISFSQDGSDSGGAER